jgi:Flp pilus assembly protein TadD
MQNSRTWAAMIGIVIVILIVLALLQRPAGAPSTTSTSTQNTASSTATQNGVTGSGEFQVTGDTVNISVPDFRSTLKFSPSIQSDVKTALQNAANTLEGRLATNSFDLASWINLGTVRKMAGDYTGAEQAWTFVTKAAPTNSIAYNNLGDLYANFIKNYPKAEQAYLTAIKISPNDEAPYINLYQMYTNFYKKGTSAAEDILKKGIVAVPDSTSLHVELARYYKSKGDSADAKTQYDAAIAAANKSGQSAAASQLQVEENQ